MKAWGIKCWFSFLSKCVTGRVEKLNDRWRQHRQMKNSQNGWNWLMRPTLTRFPECSLAFMKKWKTLFDFKVLQISSIYDKKCALKYLPKSAVWIENQDKLPSLTQSAENSRTFFKKLKTLFDFDALKLKLLLFSRVSGKKKSSKISLKVGSLI